MRKTIIISLFLLILSVSGCSASSKGISGTVVDVETGKPIEGAVVLVEWTRTTGIGDKHTVSAKVAETVTDKEGKFKLPGCYSPFVNIPDLAIYKKGYVTWSSRNIFPARAKRDDFQWRSGNIYKLEKFKDSYSYVDHYGFTTSAINSTIGGPNDKQLFFRTFSEAEEAKVIHEQSERDKQRQGGIKR